MLRQGNNFEEIELYQAILLIKQKCSLASYISKTHQQLRFFICSMGSLQQKREHHNLPPCSNGLKKQTFISTIRQQYGENVQYQNQKCHCLMGRQGDLKRLVKALLQLIGRVLVQLQSKLWHFWQLRHAIIYSSKVCC